MMRKVILFTGCCTLVLGGCQMLHSTSVNPVAVGDPAASQTAVVDTHEGGSYPLPMSLITLTIKQETGKENSYYITEPTVKKVPDPRMLFSLDFSESITSSDSIKVERDENGFLKKVTLGADDKSTEIIKAIANTVLTLLSGVPVGVGGEPRADIAVATDQVVFQRVIDPLDEKARQEVNNIIKKFGFSIVINPLKETGKRASDIIVENVDEGGKGGLYYRHPIPYLLEVNKTVPATGVSFTVAEYMLYLENKAPLIRIDTSRTFFAKKDITLNFAQGQLVDSEIKKGSELLNIVSIPYDIANAIVSLPTKILQLKIDTTGKEKTLIDNNKAIIDSQTQLMETQRKYLDLLNKEKPKNGSGNSADCPPGTKSELCGD